PVKALIITGAVETAEARGEGLLDETDAARLGDGAKKLMILSGRDMTRMQKLNMSSLISLTDEYLLVTRPISDTAGRAVAQGSLMRSILSIMPDMPLRGAGDAGKLSRICFEQGELALTRVPGAIAENDDSARAFGEALKSIDGYREKFERVMSAKNFRVYSEKLPPSIMRDAYGPLDTLSVSRLERYASCPFRHFASYAIRPEEFRVYELSPRDAGIFYHEALERFMKKYAPSLGEMTAEQSRESMDEITGQLIDKALSAAFEPSELEKAEAGRMRVVARRAAEIITRQFDGSKFIPVGLEADIEAQTATVAIDDARLIGRIDRVDVFEDEDSRYVRVVDYKKGSRKVSLPEIYAGLQLQLTLYLATAISRYDGKPAGMFYFSVRDPLIDTDERDPELVDLARRKLLRLDGITLDDKRVVEAMAEDPELSVNVSINKDGSIKKSERVLSQEDFDALIKRGVEVAAQMLAGIRDGSTDISPAQTSSGSACDWCEFKTLCQFDQRLPGAEFRPIGITRAKDVLDALRSPQ
ncbi:MAG: PD-(D/E)XK nuclease family protein, partial [Clostridia bacterium]|nr:PD-(D/E)XK nuclease family protein [Clostridia bacterium]